MSVCLSDTLPQGDFKGDFEGDLGGKFRGDFEGDSEGDFDGAFTGNFGVRLHPSSKAGGRLQGLLGLDYSHEVFNENASGSSGLITEVEVPFGVRQYIRNDIRLLAGGRVHVAQQLTLSVHVGVGYSRQHEALPTQTNLGRQTSPKLLGMELLYWL